MSNDASKAAADADAAVAANNGSTPAVVSPLVIPSTSSTTILSTAREVLEMGATRMVIPGNFPTRFVPTYLSAVNEKDPSAYDGNSCLIGLNLFAQMHHMMLQQGIRELRESYLGATIAYADYFSAYVQMFRDASKMGFDGTAVTKACCGAGAGAYNVGVDRMCGAPGTEVCARPDEYISWDGVHLTQHAYRVMSELLYHRGLASLAPVNFPTL